MVDDGKGGLNCFETPWGSFIEHVVKLSGAKRYPGEVARILISIDSFSKIWFGSTLLPQRPCRHVDESYKLSSSALIRGFGIILEAIWYIVEVSNLTLMMFQVVWFTQVPLS